MGYHAGMCLFAVLAALAEGATYDRLRFGVGSYTQGDWIYGAAQGFDTTATVFVLPWLAARVQAGVNARLAGSLTYPTGPTGEYLPYILVEGRLGEDVGPFCTLGPGLTFWRGFLFDASGGWTFELSKRVRLSAVGRLGVAYVGVGAELEIVAL